MKSFLQRKSDYIFKNAIKLKFINNLISFIYFLGRFYLNVYVSQHSNFLRLSCAIYLWLCRGELELYSYNFLFSQKKLFKIPGIVIYFSFPILTEILLDVYSALTFSQKKYLKKHIQKHESLNKIRHPLIYHPRYNITACGLEKIHPFDSSKYSRVVSFLRTYGLIDSGTVLYKPEMISRAILSCVKLIFV